MPESSFAIFMVGLLCGVIMASIIYSFCIALGERDKKRRERREQKATK